MKLMKRGFTRPKPKNQKEQKRRMNFKPKGKEDSMAKGFHKEVDWGPPVGEEIW